MGATGAVGCPDACRRRLTKADRMASHPGRETKRRHLLNALLRLAAKGGIGLARSGTTGDPPEHSGDGDAEAGKVALTKHIGGHDRAGGEKATRSGAVGPQYPGVRGDGNAKMGEGNPWSQWVTEKRRSAQWVRATRLRWQQSDGGSLHWLRVGRCDEGCVEAIDGTVENCRIELQLVGRSPTSSA